MIDAIKHEFGDRLKIGLILGGLRPGTTEAITEQLREEILQHWRHVNELSGQPFVFDGAMPEGFIYDTEPPSRAVVAMGELKPDSVLDYFKAIQQAFYVEQKNVAQEYVLLELARNFDIDAQQFIQQFQAETIRQKTLAHFYRARRFGVRGFPTLISENGVNPVVLTAGYQSYDVLKSRLESWLDSF